MSGYRRFFIFMRSFSNGLGSPLCWPLLPLWLLVALLPFGRSAELGTLWCLIALLARIVRLGPVSFWQEQSGGTAFLLLLGAYVGAALCSTLGALVPAKTWLCIAGLVRYFALGLYASSVLRRGSVLFKFYDGVALIVVVWVVVAWLQMLTGWHVRGVTVGPYLTGLFGDNLKFGPTLAVLSAFVLWVARERWGMRAAWLAFTLLLGPILLAGSRSAWLSYLLVALLFAGDSTVSRCRFVGRCALGAVLLLLAVALAWKVSTHFDVRAERSLGLFRGDAQGLDSALTGRVDIWRVSMRMIAAHPWFGVGVRGFRYGYPHYAPTNDHFVVIEPCGVGQGACHPHQWLLEVLVGSGVVGLMCWLLAIVWACRRWYYAASMTRWFASPPALALVAMLFPFNTHLAFYSAWWGLLFAWLVSCWCAALYVVDTS